MSIALIGLNHTSASLELRGRLALSESAQRSALGDGAHVMASDAPLHELALLSTCNRTELYAGGVTPGRHEVAWDFLAGFLATQAGVAREDFAPSLYRLHGDAVARHLCRVAAGLDSMVPGEGEILGQVARAFSTATHAGATGTELDQAFRCARRAGRRVRAETAVGHGSASVGGEAARLISEVVGPMEGRCILIVGTGKVGRSAGRALCGVAQGGRVMVIGRTAERAAELAQHIGATALGWSDLVTAVREADVIFSATGAPHAVLTHEVVERAIGAPGDLKSRLFVDVAVPRDVEATVRALPGVTLYDLDDLQVRIEATLTQRRQDVPAAERIIDEELEHFRSDLHDAELRPLLSDLRARGNAIRERELERLWRRLGALSPEVRREIEAFSDSLLRKLLHDPSRVLRETRDPDAARVYTSAARALFGLRDAS